MHIRTGTLSRGQLAILELRCTSEQVQSHPSNAAVRFDYKWLTSLGFTIYLELHSYSANSCYVTARDVQHWVLAEILACSFTCLLIACETCIISIGMQLNAIRRVAECSSAKLLLYGSTYLILSLSKGIPP